MDVLGQGVWRCLGQAGETVNTYGAGGNKMGVAEGGTGWDEARAGMLGGGWPPADREVLRGGPDETDQHLGQARHLWESLKATDAAPDNAQERAAETNETPGAGDTDREVWSRWGMVQGRRAAGGGLAQVRVRTRVPRPEVGVFG